jgi:hypothetical protein
LELSQLKAKFHFAYMQSILMRFDRRQDRSGIPRAFRGWWWHVAPKINRGQLVLAFALLN